MSKRISFEFFPPKTEKGREKLLNTQKNLLAKKPEFFSCTFGAGGSTRDNTRQMVDLLREQHADTAPHLSCIGQSRDEIMELVNGYKESGVRRIVALRGDLPSGMGYAQSEVKYADDLVALIREETGDHFHLEVAAYPENHPQSRSFDDDIAHFQRKISAGADSGITQYFYNADAYGYYMDELRRRGCDAPVYPGVMPILNVANLFRFSDNCRYPALAAQPSGRHPRRRAGGESVRRGSGDPPLRAPAGDGRPGPALLHHEPVRPDSAGAG